MEFSDFQFGFSPTQDSFKDSSMKQNIESETSIDKTMELNQRIVISKQRNVGKILGYEWRIPHEINIQDILLLGELMINMNIFNQRGKSYSQDSDYPWNSLRPAQRLQQFKDGSMLTYHENAVKGSLQFQDTLNILWKLPDQTARQIASKLTKYQEKINHIQIARQALLEFYSQGDLQYIFAEMQRASIEKSMNILNEIEDKSLIHERNEREKLNELNSNYPPNEQIGLLNRKIYLYVINSINEVSLLPTPVAVGQNSGLVELMGGNYEAYKQQILRKGFLNFDSLESHLELLLLELGSQKEGYIEARTIEGFCLPFHIQIKHHFLQSIKLAPLEIPFNSSLVIYDITVNPQIIKAIECHRKQYLFDGLPDDLSYMLDCQIFLQKHYKSSFDLSSERRCHYKTLNELNKRK